MSGGKPDPGKQDKLPISPPSKQRPAPKDGVPDLFIEEIEEKHIPKDRNIFDK